tara:strand:+ start:4902 stop:5768 length:867 start_codon:yes stop_codon:yes gene_type:complete
MRGIILAGGAGSRLFPNTVAVSKQLLPIYDKPLIYYPISTLIEIGIKEILIITAPDQVNNFKKLLGDGKQWGITLDYIIQPEPGGLPQAFTLGEDFIGKEPCCLILGDNIFYGKGINDTIIDSSKNLFGARIFTYQVSDPERYGVVEFDKNGKALSIEEKPKNPRSNYAITGLYIFDETVVEKSKSLKPSKRGELEITDLINLYKIEEKLFVTAFNKGMAWLDTGTHESLIEASLFIHTLEKRQGFKIACIEEIVLKRGYINEKDLKNLVSEYGDTDYSDYMIGLIKK